MPSFDKGMVRLYYMEGSRKNQQPRTGILEGWLLFLQIIYFFGKPDIMEARKKKGELTHED